MLAIFKYPCVDILLLLIYDVAYHSSNSCKMATFSARSMDDAEQSFDPPNSYIHASHVFFSVCLLQLFVTWLAKCPALRHQCHQRVAGDNCKLLFLHPIFSHISTKSPSSPYLLKTSSQSLLPNKISRWIRRPGWICRQRAMVSPRHRHHHRLVSQLPLPISRQNLYSIVKHKEEQIKLTKSHSKQPHKTHSIKVHHRAIRQQSLRLLHLSKHLTQR